METDQLNTPKTTTFHHQMNRKTALVSLSCLAVFSSALPSRARARAVGERGAIQTYATRIKRRKRNLAIYSPINFVSPSKCDDICWDGNNCGMEQCQQCPFSCAQVRNTTQNNADVSPLEAIEDEDNEYNPELPAAYLPKQCETIFSKTCSHKCINEADCRKVFCSECSFCNYHATSFSASSTNKHENTTPSPSTPQSSSSSCLLETAFQDYTTSTLLKKTRHYFNRFRHSGKPYFHESPPTFFHLNNDSTLDYFNPMHGHPLFDEGELSRRLEIALSMAVNNTDYGTVYSLRQIANHIIIEDDFDDLKKLDLHGCVVADLDADGYLDIYITNGGNMGLFKEDDDPTTYDNLLFWGEASKTMIDKETGEPITLFRGGRKAALDANIHMRNGRGRFVSLLDVNHDGLLDLFVAQDRRVSNDLVPGYLLINQGKRIWKKDSSMEEYSRTLMVTDADGDGFANEVVLNRSFCYPQRNGPDTDPIYMDLGDFSSSMEQFCSTRPVGSTVIFQYNKQTKNMDQISKPFINFGAHTQPTCCPHTSYDGSNNCNAISMESGDFDNDNLADHIFLYKYKMEFYFSSDRVEESYPTLGHPRHVGLKIEFPSYCGAAMSVRVTDLDNDGHDEIFVTCENAGTFLVYTRTGSESRPSPQYKTSWTLQNGCNNNDSLGSMNDRFLASPTENDFHELCSEAFIQDWVSAKKLCNDYQKKGQIPAARTSGISIIDLDMDGFSDIVVAHSFGYLRFFRNTPSIASSSNRYISFDLSDTTSNGIGVTLILHSIEGRNKSESKEPKVVTQFRCMSSYLHGTDRHSTKDIKITFGLGKTLEPYRLEVRWPDTKTVEMIDLTEWKFSTSRNTKDKWIKIKMQQSPLPTPHNISPQTMSQSPSQRMSVDPSFDRSPRPSIIADPPLSRSPSRSIGIDRSFNQNPSQSTSSPSLSSKPSCHTDFPSTNGNVLSSSVIIGLTDSAASKNPSHQLFYTTVGLILAQMILF